MSPEEFRQYGHQVVDWIADYLSNVDERPVLAQVEPGFLKKAVPTSPPLNGEDMTSILADMDSLILPGVTHWNHPGFFAYFSTSGSGPGILGEMFSAVFNVNAMLWRTCPSATELEEITIDWTRQMIGLPDDFGGVIYDTASMSNLCALVAAREAIVPRANEGGTDVDYSQLRLYVSEHTHSSIEKSAAIIGLGRDSLRKVPADSEFRMKPEALSAAIEEDLGNGYQPFCTVATVGTTSTTSVDPVRAVSEVCRKHKLWLHVDAAYGGSAAVVPEMRWILDGCEKADSLVMNPHKWMFVPLDLSILFCRRMDMLRQAFSLIPEFLRSPESDVHNFMDYGPQLGRRFRAIKLWFVQRYFGVNGIAEVIRGHLEMARELECWIEESNDFELLAPVRFSNVCFRACPVGYSDDLNALNERLMESVNREGRMFLSHTKLDGKLTLRLAIGNIRTTRDHVKLAWKQLNEHLEKLVR